ncbi:hypothetical protein INR75_02015 [Zunongwangia sp. SCSIO 43204]|uniref:hypothetical protein n=1 Tax=Zunongwangia sp. SCSIO 43204 TaxID=2779359 RepID=UPI001CA965CD|nr:hypothetical protein [Zunongwangia sp. SCSIO 43204]UAB84827.1 hypothetical protein INR75_02015 [Zunongwangia sp. SCSIO 43204]
MTIKVRSILPFSVLALTFISVDSWSIIPIGNTAFQWGVSLLILIMIIYYYNKIHLINRRDYRIVFIYLVWTIFNIVRGITYAKYYWDWKQLVSGSLALLLPSFVYVYNNPALLNETLKVWFRYALFVFFVFFIWVTSNGSKHFYLGPVLLLSCFLPSLRKKYRLLFLALLIMMLFIDIGARSQVLKTAAALLLSISFFLKYYLKIALYKFLFWFFSLTPCLLVILGLSGVFNIFTGFNSFQGDDYRHTRFVNGRVVDEDLTADTRTGLYKEVVFSALKNNYVILGRTPARGNDSELFGEGISTATGLDRHERHSNEVLFLNVFNWNGLIGLILYCLIYFKSAYLSIYKSNNIYLKIIGVYVIFRFAYGWVEDFNRFDIMNISLWMAIAMGFSITFRKMTNQDFKLWLNSNFRK